MFKRRQPARRLGVYGQVCRTAEDLEGLAFHVEYQEPHLAIITDRAHRVVAVEESPTLEALADSLSARRLDGLCVGVVSAAATGDEAVVAQWRLRRITQRGDACFFGWVTPRSRGSVAA